LVFLALLDRRRSFPIAPAPCLLGARGHLALADRLAAIVQLHLARRRRTSGDDFGLLGPHRERHPARSRVHANDAHIDRLPLCQNFADVRHEPIRELGDVHETIRLRPEVDESAIRLHGGHCALVDVANRDVVKINSDLALGAAPTTRAGGPHRTPFSPLPLRGGGGGIRGGSLNHLGIGIGSAHGETRSAGHEVVTGLVHQAGERRAAVEGSEADRGSLSPHRASGNGHAGDGVHLSNGESSHCDVLI